MPRPPREWLELLFSWYLRTIAVAYIFWGCFFLALAPHFPPAFQKDVFSNGFVWGGGFIIIGILTLNSLTLSNLEWYRNLVVVAVVTWMAVFIAIWFTILLGTANPLLSMVLILFWPLIIEIINVISVISQHEENAMRTFQGIRKGIRSRLRQQLGKLTSRRSA